MDLNCCFCDATLMKDFFSYRLFRISGVPAPLAGYAWITINGKDHGLYLVVEKTEKSFLNRNFGKGVLYKPCTSDMGMSLEDARYVKENGYPEDYIMEKAQGADFAYSDDDPKNYPDIFEHRKTDGGRKDEKAVIKSIKTLSQGTDLENGLDTHEIIRYFAVHNFLLNVDSYTGKELHNMVICEKDGIMSVMPWDYNLACGTYVTALGKDVLEDLTDLLNQGIDTPLIGTEEKSRPLWTWIMQDEQYRQEYHYVLSALMEGYFESGLFENELNALQTMLAPYEEKDPNAFYSKEEFEKGCDVFRQFCLRRAQSIRKQLNGELAMDNTKQNNKDKVDASDLNVLDMGAYAYLPKDKEGTNQDDQAEADDHSSYV